MYFYTPIWHLTKEDELENLHDKQKKMHPGESYNNIININNKKKIIKRKIYSKYAMHLQDAQNSAERQKVIEDCARNLLYYVAQNDDPYNAVIKHHEILHGAASEESSLPHHRTADHGSRRKLNRASFGLE